MRVLVVLLVAVASTLYAAPAPNDRFAAYRGGASGRAMDIAVAPNGDLVVVGCESGALDFDPDVPAKRPESGDISSTFVARLDRTTLRAMWTRRSASPCDHADNWSAPRVAIDATGTIWVAAHAWGRGSYLDQTAERLAPVMLLAFDAGGGLGTQRELPEGVRVLAMAALTKNRIAIAGQSALVRGRSSAFVAAIDATGAEVWRRDLPGPHAKFVDSLAVDGDRVLVGGSVAGHLEDGPGIAKGREADGFVITLGPAGAIASTITRHHAGMNVYGVQVAVANGRAFIAYKVGLLFGHRWPAELEGASDSPGGVVVEPLAAQRAWRQVFAGTTHASVKGLAATHDRLALVLSFQSGRINVGGGLWRSDDFNLGAYLEIGSASGLLLDAHRLETSGEKVFFQRVIWDGEAFAAVGHAGGQLSSPRSLWLPSYAPFVWRIP